MPSITHDLPNRTFVHDISCPWPSALSGIFDTTFNGWIVGGACDLSVLLGDVNCATAFAIFWLVGTDDGPTSGKPDATLNGSMMVFGGTLAGVELINGLVSGAKLFLSNADGNGTLHPLFLCLLRPRLVLNARPQGHFRAQLPSGSWHLATCFA